MKIKEYMRDEGVLPPWHGCLINLLSYIAILIVLAGFGVPPTWPAIAFAMAFSGLAYNIVNAFYGMKNNLFIMPRLGQGLLFFHVCVFALCVVLWSFNMVWWALGVEFFTHMVDGKDK